LGNFSLNCGFRIEKQRTGIAEWTNLWIGVLELWSNGVMELMDWGSPDFGFWILDFGIWRDA
jgi:hypothetical protein